MSSAPVPPDRRARATAAKVAGAAGAAGAGLGATGAAVFHPGLLIFLGCIVLVALVLLGALGWAAVSSHDEHVRRAAALTLIDRVIGAIRPPGR